MCPSGWQQNTGAKIARRTLQACISPLVVAQKVRTSITLQRTHDPPARIFHKRRRTFVRAALTPLWSFLIFFFFRLAVRAATGDRAQTQADWLQSGKIGEQTNRSVSMRVRRVILISGIFGRAAQPGLEQVPQELVIHFVVVLDFRRLYERS